MYEDVSYEVVSFHPSSEWFAVVVDAVDGIDTMRYERIAGWVLVRRVDRDDHTPELLGVQTPLGGSWLRDLGYGFDIHAGALLGYVHERDLESRRAEFQNELVEWSEAHAEKK